MPAYCYILECADGSYYCGWTTDLDKRVALHRAGKGSRYTRSHLPVRLCYYEQCAGRSEAMRREYALKRLSHTHKRDLVRQFEKRDR